MPSADYNLIKFGSVWLTNDATEDGLPCRVETKGLDGLWLDWDVATVQSTDGTPYNFVAENLGVGKILRLELPVVSESVLATLKTEINASLAAPATINVVITGTTGDYDLEVEPYFSGTQKALEFSGQFINDQVLDAAINVVTKSRNS